MPYQSTASLLAFIDRLLAKPPRQAAIHASAEQDPMDSRREAAPAGVDFPVLNSVSCVSYRPGPRAISAAGIALIKRFEGCARLRPDGLVEAYPDPGTGAEPWTIGWGATGRDHIHGGRIGPGTVWTQGACDARLAVDLVRYAADVLRALGDAPTTQPQFDALVSFHYNTGAIARATLTAKHRAGDTEGAAREFARWNRAGGRVLKGLVRRRAAEAEMYVEQRSD
jgi:GH24 family phage-related lysozyme (muramidase)